MPSTELASKTIHELRGLLDERLGALERCEKSARELIARSGSSLAGG